MTANEASLPRDRKNLEAKPTETQPTPDVAMEDVMSDSDRPWDEADGLAIGKGAHVVEVGKNLRESVGQKRKSEPLWDRWSSVKE